MQRNRHIAIILPDTLQALGLQALLTEFFSPIKVERFDSFHTFQRANNDLFDYFFILSDLFLINIDYFLPRKSKTMVLFNNRETRCDLCQSENASNNTNALHVNMSEETLIEQLQLFFANEASLLTHAENKELSSREIDVLQQIVKGGTNKEIADHLNISLNTVLTHRKNITSKLGIKTVSGLTFYSIMNGIISGDEIEI